MSDQGFIVSPIAADPPAISQRATDYLESVVPGYIAAPGNLDTLVIEAMAEEVAETAEVASAVTQAVFRNFGPLVGVPPIDAAPAFGNPTFTVRDASGYTIPAGSSAGLRTPDDTLIGFALDDDLVIAAGSTTGSGAVTADTEGVEGNGLSGTAEPVSLPDYVTAVIFGTPTSGGVDAEDDDLYLDRLSETLTLLAPRPILPQDFAVLARGVTGVYRATAIDGLKPGPPWNGTAEATGQSRTITVAVTDAAGDAVSAGVRAAVDAYLQSLREQDFAVYVVDPNYTDIAVTTTVQAWPGYDSAQVSADVEQAIRDYLSPATWGTGPTGDPKTWFTDPIIRLGELYQYINAVAGVRYVTALTFGPSGGTLGAADVNIAGSSAIPALPRAGAGTVAGTGINVTVVPG
jgi:uncharacterized phage protein gp47/JayE